MTKLYFATNRNFSKRGDSYKFGNRISDEGWHNLRFGEITVELDDQKVQAKLSEAIDNGIGNGVSLSKYLKKPVKRGQVILYDDPSASEKNPEAMPDYEALSSTKLFRALKEEMDNATDVVIFIHGYNVDWEEAASSALALQIMLNKDCKDEEKSVRVVLFSWPSNGRKLPYLSYISDRDDAACSGLAVARAVLKLRDFLVWLKQQVRKGNESYCRQEIHLLCHSMGNFVLQNALQKMVSESKKQGIERLFDHIYMCAPDVDEDVFEDGKEMEQLTGLTHKISVYFNRQDVAMHISDGTKMNPDRLGQFGLARPNYVHKKIKEIDCTPVVHKGLSEHSYYLNGLVNRDIRQSIDGISMDDKARNRTRGATSSEWVMHD